MTRTHGSVVDGAGNVAIDCRYPSKFGNLTIKLSDKDESQWCSCLRLDASAFIAMG